MRYRNKITGIEFTSSSVLSGDDYEEIKPTVTASKAAPKADPIVEPKAPEKTAQKRVVKSVKPVKKVKK